MEAVKVNDKFEIIRNYSYNYLLFFTYLSNSFCCSLQVKMMLAAVELFERFQLAEEDLPMFSTILFVRDTSRTPHQLFRNHLNVVGDSGGLEQVKTVIVML